MPDQPAPSSARSERSGEEGPAGYGGFLNLGPFWTWANVLTLSRFLLVPPIAWLVYVDGPILWLLALMGIALATDFFDGRVARWTGTVSEWGKILDPTADKLAAAAVTGALVFRPIEPTLDLWFVLLVIVRDVIIATGGMIQTRRLGYVMMALWSGKVAVNLLALTILAVLFALPNPIVTGLVWITTAALLYSFGRYMHRFAMVMRHGRQVPLDERHNVVRGAVRPPAG